MSAEQRSDLERRFWWTWWTCGQCHATWPKDTQVERCPQCHDLVRRNDDIRIAQDQSTDPVCARPLADLAALREAAQAVAITPCREWLDTDDRYVHCNAPAEFVLWGKMIPPKGLGPRCYEHAAKHVGDRALGDPSWAIIDLRPLRAVLASADSERITHGRHCTCSACAQER
jgi:hypothetical protein